MLAKVIACATTRAEAAHRLAEALVTAEVHGVTTNRDLLVGILRHPEFLAGATDTEFLERHDPVELQASLSGPVATHVHTIAAVLAGARARRAESPRQLDLPPSWRNVGPSMQSHEFVTPDGTTTTVAITNARDGTSADVDGAEVGIVEHHTDPATVDVEVDGHRVRCRVHRAAEHVYVDSALGSTGWSRCRASSPPPGRISPARCSHPCRARSSRWRWKRERT